MIRLKCSVCVALSLLAAPPALHAEKVWIAGSGNWADPANWSPAGVPGASETVTIAPSDGLARTVVHDSSAPQLRVEQLTLDQTGGGSNATVLAVPSGTLSVNDFLIGALGRGTVEQSGGTAGVSVHMRIGVSAGSAGTYELSGGFFDMEGEETIGGAGSGTFVQTGGTHFIYDDNPLVIGADTGGVGTYTLSAGSLLNPAIETIGKSGSGTFNQSGGTHSGGELHMAANAGSSGSYTLSGSSQLTFGYEYIGEQGVGLFTQLGGSHTSNGGVTVGVSGLGTYQLMGGTLTVVGPEIVAASAAGNSLQSGGTFIHSGGTNSISTSLDIAQQAGSTGSYALSGSGQLLATTEVVGEHGTGTFTQTGGANIVGSGGLEVGAAAEALGTYVLTGGNLKVNGPVIIGESATGNSPQSGGTFSHSGGSHNVLGTLTVGKNTASTGKYTLDSTGQLTADAMVIGQSGTGLVAQASGSASISGAGGLVIGSNAGALGSYSLDGGTLTVDGPEYVALSAIGNSNQAGGMFSQSSGVHRVGSLSTGHNAGAVGSMSLTGGTFVSSGAESIGRSGIGNFLQTGGSNASAGDIIIGANAGSSGTYGLSGGFASAPNIYVGGNSSGAGGTGKLTISATLTVPGTITVYNTPGTKLTLGGTLNVGGINVGGVPSLFNWTGGMLNITNDVTWDPGAPANSTSTIFGNSLSLFDQHTLKVTGNETIGGNGAFNLTLNAGTKHIVTGDISLKTGSLLTVYSTGLSYGTFVQAGGTIAGSSFRNSTNFVYDSGLVQTQFVNAGTVSFGARWSISGSLQNETSMSVAGGQTLSATGGITNLGNFTISSGTIGSGGQVTNTVSGILTAHGTITPQVTNQGTLIVDGPLMAAITNTGIVHGAGTVTSPSNSFANNAGGVVNATTPGGALAFTFAFSNNAGAVVNVGPTSTFSVGQTVSNSGQINLQGAGSRLSTGTLTNNGVIQGFGTITSQLGTSSSGVFRASGGELDFTATSISNPAPSTVQVMPGSTVAYLQGMAGNSGTISLVGGTFENTGKLLSNQGTINGYGTIRTGGLTNATGRLISIGGGDMEVFGPVTNSGTVNIQSGRTAYFFGNVGGSGAYTGTGTAVFLGNLTPGNPVGFATFGGNAVLTGGTSLAIDLAGTAPGAQYDQLHVAGQLAIGGALSVSLLGGFMPAVGSSFDLMDWGTLAGTFSSINLPTLAAGQWDTSQLYNTGVLSVVPSPLAGDFNSDGTVDAADFVVWRKGLGTTYAQGDYDVWRANFGRAAGSGQSIQGDLATVPEPGLAVLVAFLSTIAVVVRVRLATALQ